MGSVSLRFCTDPAPGDPEPDPDEPDSDEDVGTVTITSSSSEASPPPVEAKPPKKGGRVFMIPVPVAYLFPNLVVQAGRWAALVARAHEALTIFPKDLSNTAACLGLTDVRSAGCFRAFARSGGCFACGSGGGRLLTPPPARF